jgi:signal peptidase II
VWRQVIFPLTAAFVVAVDQISKQWIRSHSVYGETLFESGRLRLIHSYNTGSAFGLFTDHSFILSIIAIIGLVVILLFYRYQHQSRLFFSLTLGLIFGGALGNLIDRLRLGHVTDFIDVRLWGNFHWPTFNAADSAISVGMIALICFIVVGLIKEKDHSRETRS